MRYEKMKSIKIDEKEKCVRCEGKVTKPIKFMGNYTRFCVGMCNTKRVNKT